MNLRKRQANNHPNRKDTPKLDDSEVLHRAEQTLKSHLPLEAFGSSCTSTPLYQVLIGVAANRRTIEAVCADLAGSPDGQTIRGYLNDQLRVEQLPLLQQRLNAALRANWPKPLRRGGPLE